jgi:hypothetical protein
MTRLLSLIAVLGCLGIAACSSVPDGSSAGAKEASNLRATIPSVWPAEVPLIFELTIVNTGDVSLSALNGGPGPFLPACGCEARIAAADGTTAERPLTNGNRVGMTNAIVSLRPGEKTMFPAACAPLKPGSYAVRLIAGPRLGTSPEWPAMTSEVKRLTIRDDAELARTIINDLLARARSGDAFAGYISVRFTITPVVEGLLADLSSENALAAWNAATVLERVGPSVPPGWGPALKRGVARQLDLHQSRFQSYDASALDMMRQMESRITDAKPVHE